MITLILFIALIAMASFGYAAESTEPGSSNAPNQAAPNQPSKVTGEVIMMTQEFIVIRGADGKGVQVLLDKGSQVDGAVKTGAVAEASLNAQGIATAVKPAK